MSYKCQLLIKRVTLLCLFVILAQSLFALDGEVISIIGKAEIQSGDKWVQLNTGDIVKKGAVVSTGFKSEVALKIGNSTFVVQPLSRITIEQLAEQNGNQASQMFLDTGSIKADVKPVTNKRVGFTVRSPVATASVRGTAGTMSANGTLISTENTWSIWPTPKDQQGAQIIGSIDNDQSAPASQNNSDGNDVSGNQKNTEPSSSSNKESSGEQGLPEMTQPPVSSKPRNVPQGASVSTNNKGNISTPLESAVKESLTLEGTTTNKANQEALSTGTGATANQAPSSNTGVAAAADIKVNVIINW